MKIENIVQMLEALAEQARTEESIFRTAAVDADGLSLTSYSVSCATLCADRVAELDGIAMLYRAGKMRSPHLFAPARRAWLWLRACVRTRSDRRIIDDCTRQQDASRRAYLRALTLDLPGTLRVALNNHLATIKDCLTGLARMRHHTWQRSYMAEHAPAVSSFPRPGSDYK